jgi:DNA-binding beta-propeller fold protein YncE
VLNTSTLQIISRIRVGNLPHVILVSPTGRHNFVTNGLSNSISVISGYIHTVSRTINLLNGLLHLLGLTFIQ